MKLMEDEMIAGRYRLLRLCGRGSFGEVWLAQDEQIGLEVAVKVYIALDDRGIEDFKTEFRQTYALNHPNLLHATYFDVWESRPYLVMQYCPASSVSLIGKTDETQFWKFLRDVSSGLAYLHEQDVIHRDIKPDNILMDGRGKFLISDFGISAKIQSTLRRNSTRQQSEKSSGGSLPYMAPELFSANPEQVKASDIWSLGATLYELIVGELPFLGHGGVMLLGGAQMPGVKGASKEIEAVVQACLAKEPWDRPMAAQLATYAAAKLRGESPIAPWANREQATRKEAEEKKKREDAERKRREEEERRRREEERRRAAEERKRAEEEAVKRAKRKRSRKALVGTIIGLFVCGVILCALLLALDYVENMEYSRRQAAEALREQNEQLLAAKAEEEIENARQQRVMDSLKAENERLLAAKAEEQRVQDSLKAENERLLAAKGYIDIKSVAFVNTDKNNNMISGMYAQDIIYLKPVLSYSGLSNKKETIKISVKIYKPDGTLARGKKSPEGYTWSENVTIKPGANSVRLLGWGNDNGGTYTSGVYRFEFWHEGKKLYTQPISLKYRASARIDSVWVDYDQVSKGERGMMIHVKFNVKGMKDKQDQVAAYFYYEDGSPLKDVNNNYWTSDGHVAISDYYTPSYESSSWSDFKMFMPYSELDISGSGKYDLYFTVSIWGGGEVMDKSKKQHFTYTRY